MNDLPSSIRNLGPASDIFFAAADIKTADQLRELGADEAYYQALMAGGKAHFIGYYALVMGLQGRPWNDCHGPEKEELKRKFSFIKKRLSPKDTAQSDLDKALDALGVVPQTE